jgi:hypothetical protein
MPYEILINAERTQAECRSNYDEISTGFWCFFRKRDVTSGTEKTLTSFDVSTAITLNPSTNSGMSKISYMNAGYKLNV